jgi:mono/diheme cytochrome c family protein
VCFVTFVVKIRVVRGISAVVVCCAALLIAVTHPFAQTPASQSIGAGQRDNSDADFSPKAPVLPKSAAEQQKTFVLPTGYRMELVLAEPDVNTPAVIEFDGNGRMYVAEFANYMRDLDGTGEHEPVARITRWESTKGDGRYDRKTVFADKLVLPRMIVPLQDGVILTNETDKDDVIQLTDVNGDGVADKKERFYTGVGRTANLEHQQSGFVWGLDNWIYSTYNAFRFRWTPQGILREPTAPNYGQWGVAVDDDGKPWFLDAGGEKGPMNFQVPVQYGAFSVADGIEPGFDTVWPMAGVGDMEGGMARVRMPLGVVNHFTATNGPAIVRAHRMPVDLLGDLLFCEPVGRLIRRAKIVRNEGLTQLRNAHPGSEFILSSDLLFRPVNIRNAPDGTMFVVDMYHGIIQEAEWTPPRSYLRAKIEQYQLQRVVDRGRIWRLRYDGRAAVPPLPGGPGSGSPSHGAIPGIDPDLTQPRMYSDSAEQLVAHLNHPNGWWRDTAQRLLVLKQDKSVVSALTRLARSASRAEAEGEGGRNLLGRIHAMWTLEGLGALDAPTVRAQMEDASPRMRVQAIRASETLFKAGDKSLLATYRTMAGDPDPDVAIQALLTLNVLKAPDVAEVIRTTQSTNRARGVTSIGNRLMAAPGFLPGTVAQGGRGGPARSPEQQELMTRGGQIFSELCFSCHGEDGRGAPMAGAEPGATLAPSLVGSPRVLGHRDYVIKVLLHGLTGPVAGKTYTQTMIPMGQNRDEWIAAAASFVRNSFSNTAGFVSPEDVSRVRKATTTRKTPWTVAELEGSLPRMMDWLPSWQATASHNNATAERAFTLVGWTTGTPQQISTWFQIELPAQALLTEIQFDSATTGRRGGGGAVGAPNARGGGAGAAGATPGVNLPANGAPPAAGAPPSEAPVTQSPPTVGRRGTPPAPGTAPARGAPGLEPQTTTAARGAPPAGGATSAPGAPATPGQTVNPLTAALAANGFPRAFTVMVSADGSRWGAPVAEGKGSGTRTIISFAPVPAKFIRIAGAVDPAGQAPPWSITNLRLFEQRTR